MLMETWGLWEVVRFRWEWGPHDGINALIRRDNRKCFLSIPQALEDIVGKEQSASQEVSSHWRIKLAGTLILGLLSLQNCEKQISLV